ncbi:DUF732 domain-containing protein [Streptomyces sp. B21-106]|uniref:DUF732 domain-containing protein n=1 Tax=Streptomyces sp. B21-106 TaxID=3039418 RepID=UPI002FF16F9C
MRTTTLLLAAACLALAGCSSTSSSDKPAATPAASSPSVNPQDAYLAVAHGITFNGTPTDEELLAYPQQWCDALAAGHGVKWMFDMTGGGGMYPIGMEWGTAKADANTLLVAGVKAYCPARTAAVTEELRAAGEY